jgi:hypothetical protein
MRVRVLCARMRVVERRLGAALAACGVASDQLENRALVFYLHYPEL